MLHMVPNIEDIILAIPDPIMINPWWTGNVNSLHPRGKRCRQAEREEDYQNACHDDGYLFQYTFSFF